MLYGYAKTSTTAGKSFKQRFSPPHPVRSRTGGVVGQQDIPRSAEALLAFFKLV